jgi:hypothetical protein
MSFIRNFLNDLNIAVQQDLKKKSINYGRVIFVCSFITAYILSKSYYEYYKGLQSRMIIIKNLRANNKILPEFESKLI